MATSWDRLLKDESQETQESGGNTSWDKLLKGEETSVQEESPETESGFFQGGSDAPYGVGPEMSEGELEGLKAARGIEGEEGSVTETWNPAEIMASIFTGGSYAAYRIGGQSLGKSLMTGGREAVAGTLSEIPISLVGEKLRESYGWAPALLVELSGGLAAGMTIDDYISRKLDDVGRAIGKSTNLKNLSRRSEEEQDEVLNILDTMMRTTSDRGDLVEPAIPEVGESEVVDINTLLDIPQLKVKDKGELGDLGRRTSQEAPSGPSDEALRAQRTQANRRAKQLENFEQARRMQRGEGPTGAPEDEMPEPARTMARRAREAAAKKRQEIWDENRLKEEMEKYEDEEAAISRLNELRRENQLETYSKEDLKNSRIGSKSIPKEEAVAERSSEQIVKEGFQEASEGGKRNFIRIADVRKRAKAKGLSDEETDQAIGDLRQKGEIDLGGGDPSTMTQKDIQATGPWSQEGTFGYWSMQKGRNWEDVEVDTSAGAKQLTEEEGISTETTILKKDGNPYKSKKSAQSALKRKGLKDTYRIVEHGDGFTLKGPSEQARMAKKSGPGRPSEPAKKVDLEEREALIRKIANKRGASQITKEDEFKADFAQIADEYQPKSEAEVPTRQGRSKQEENHAQIQKDIEEFFEPYTDRDIDDEIPLKEFENGQVRDEYEYDVGFEDDIGYRDDDFISLQDLEPEEDSARTFDDFLEDFSTVFGKKIGLTIDDISKTGTRDQVQAAERLIKDLKRHRQKAVRAGLDLAEYYKELGFSDPIAQRLKKQTEILTQKEPGEAVEEASEAAQKSGEEVDPNKVFGAIKSKLSVEWPFRKIGAPESGFAFKNYYSLKDMYEEEGRHTILRLSRKFGLDEEDFADVALKRENPNHDLSRLPEAKQKRIGKAVDFVNEYLEKSFKDHKDAGILEKPFPDSFIERQQTKISNMQEQLKKEGRPAKRVKLDAEIAEAQRRIEAVEGTRYTPIIREWLRDLANSDPQNFNKIVRLLNQKKRETPTIKSLLDAGLVNRDQIDIRDIISHYARRKSEDIANKKLLDALEDDGLAKRVVHKNEKGKVIKREKSDWPQADKDRLPLFKDHVMHPRVKDYLEDFYKNIGRRNGFERTMSTIKMAQFYNPVIMPMYDTYQTTMLHGLRSYKIPKHIRDGIESAFKNDEEFQEAAANGLFSKPFSNPMGSWQESIRKAKLPMKKRALDLMNPMPHKAVKNYYNMAWDSAWMGDQIIRMATYKELKERGFSPKAAGQLGALFHGDYASIPAGTRRKLNHFLFTPTFKLVMGKLYGEMANSAMKTGQEFGKAKLPGKKTRALAGGLMGLLAVNQGKDMLMQHWGFERDTWGRRYTKEVDTEEGPREVVVTFSDPANLPIQAINKAYEAINPSPGAQGTPLGRFIEGNKYQFHPALRTVFYDFQENRRIDGGRIYSEGDSALMKGLKMGGYLTEQFLPIVRAFGLGDEDKEQREALNKEFGKIQRRILRTFAFPYVRKTKEQRLKYRIRNLDKEIWQDANEGMITEERVERYRDKYNELRKEIQED